MINAVTCNGAQFTAVGTAVGAQMGAHNKLLILLYYAPKPAQLTNSVKIIVQHYFPQQGNISVKTQDGIRLILLIPSFILSGLYSFEIHKLLVYVLDLQIDTCRL